MAQTVIVTGATRGIGRAIALGLAATYSLVLVARDESSLRALADGIGAQGGTATAVPADLSDQDAPAKIREAALKAYGRPWGLVNNAGRAGSAPLADTDDDLVRGLMQLNFEAPMRLMRAIVPDMVEAGAGRVINICSTAALVGYPYVSAYAASKHALLGATRSLAREFARKGVTFNAVCPGYVRTGMLEQTLERIVKATDLEPAQAEERLKRMSPQGRIFEPEEVANLVRFLLAEESKGISGQALTIDGGEIEH